MNRSEKQVVPSRSALPVAGYRTSLLSQMGITVNPLLHIDGVAPISAELVRTFVWALWKQGKIEDGIVRDEIGADFAELKSNVIQMLRAMGWLVKAANSEYEYALNHLRYVGDIERIGDARFAPTPLRLVDAGSSRFFISGGQPTRMLPPAIANRVAHIGIGRWLTGSWTIESPLNGATIQSLSAWLRRPHRSLLEHFGLMFDLPRDRNVEATDTASVRAYVPELCNSRDARFSQSQRWKPISELQGKRTALISFRTTRPGTRYSIGDLEDGRVLAISEPFRSSPDRGRPDDVRRLQFAIDSQLDRPLHIEQVSPTWIGLECSLPAPETRLLLMSTNKMPTVNGRDYPQRWQFLDAETFQLWKTAVSALGVRVVPML